LIAATKKEGEAITDEEAVSMIFQIILAGNDSSSSTMGSALRFLAEKPERQKNLRNDPSRI